MKSVATLLALWLDMQKLKGMRLFVSTRLLHTANAQWAK